MDSVENHKLFIETRLIVKIENSRVVKMLVLVKKGAQTLCVTYTTPQHWG